MENPVHYTIVANDSAVGSLVQSLKNSQRVAIDMEADSLHHYFEKVCLIQLSADGCDYIVDPLADLDLAPLFTELAGKRLVFHGADYDLRMLRHDFGFEPENIFDTMVAGQLLGLERFNLAALVEKHFGLVLVKTGQKADWSRRPLSDSLLDYAARDTHYLEALADILEQELAEKERLEWHQEICEHVIQQALTENHHPENDKLWRIKGWHTLQSRRSYAILKELWEWREEEARRADLPTYKILRNEALVELVKQLVAQFPEICRNPKQRVDWSQLPALPRNCVGRRFDGLKRAAERGVQLEESSWPVSIRHNTKRPPANEATFKELRKLRDEVAKELQLDPGVLLPASTITSLAVQAPSTLDEMKTMAPIYLWQVDLLGERILEIICRNSPSWKHTPEDS